MSKGRYTPSLCWDCANATRPDVCPWVEDFTPVDGWDAEPTICHEHAEQPYESYRVRNCPLFERDAIRGGVKRCVLRGDAEHKAASELAEIDREILVAYANCSMSVLRASRAAHYDRRTISNHLNFVRDVTGLDPRDFYCLTRLINAINYAREEEKRGISHD